MEVRSNVDIFMEWWMLLSSILSFCSFIPLCKGLTNYFITVYVFEFHSVHYLLVSTSASVEAFPLSLHEYLVTRNHYSFKKSQLYISVKANRTAEVVKKTDQSNTRL